MLLLLHWCGWWCLVLRHALSKSCRGEDRSSNKAHRIWKSMNAQILVLWLKGGISSTSSTSFKDPYAKWSHCRHHMVRGGEQGRKSQMSWFGLQWLASFMWNFRTQMDDSRHYQLGSADLWQRLIKSHMVFICKALSLWYVSCGPCQCIVLCI